MKPRIFIGSSGKAKKYAEAIHDSLTDLAECIVWTEGAFGLSASTLDNLLKNLRDSDFGAFIFAADDRLSTNGDLLNVPRDNVVFEAGLFCGHLCPRALLYRDSSKRKDPRP
jgi:predicted nucleotide-binding protein